MRYHLTVPARINILGNPSDANEGDFATISAAVNVYAGALVEPAPNIVIESGPRSRLQIGLPFERGACEPKNLNQETEPTLRLESPLDALPLPYNGQLDLLKGAINRLYAYSSELRQKMKSSGVRIAAWSHVPRQSGLGGSSLLAILGLAGLRAVYDLDLQAHNDYILAELTQRVEARELGIACGFADRYVPIFGGLAYTDYRGKLLHAKIGQEPFVTYERLDPWVDDLPIVAITTGIQHNSGDVHGRMRPRYLKEYAAWVRRGGEAPPMVVFMQGAWETAWRGKMALLRGDLPAFGALMNENHRLVDKMMSYCGFEDGAGWANNLCIETALSHGALGAKLTGAGGGGSVYALVPPGEETAMIQNLSRAAADAGLDKSRIYRPTICRRGLVIQEL